MTSSEAYPRAWPRGRWIFFILLVTAGQLGFIFWLGQREWPAQIPPAPSPSLIGVNRAAQEWLEMDDPTLFALPHVRGFSGLAWIEVPPRPARNFDWTEPPRLMALPVGQLGQLFTTIMATNQPPSNTVAFRAFPAPTEPPPAPWEGFPTQSTVRVEGDVEGRTLLTPLTAPAWPHVELLSPTVVQVVVDARGWPVSTALLSSSGRVDVDQFALNQARGVRFEPLPERESADPSQIAKPLAWIRLVFDWLTLPSPPTNTVVPAP